MRILWTFALCLALAGPAARPAAQQPSAQLAALKIVVLEGEDAVNIIQQKTAVAPVVEVRDRNDLPVGGVPVRFAIRGGGARFAGGARTLTVTTDAAGRATATGLTPSGAGAYQIDVSATYQGQTATTRISQRTVMTSAEATGGAGGAGAAAAGAGAAAGGGGGMSAITVTSIVAGAVAGGAVTARALTAGTAPAVSGVTASPSSTIVGTETAIAFSAQTTATGSLSYDWDFGDGGRSRDASPTHVYRRPGSYTVRVEVGSGRKSTEQQTTVEVRSLSGTWRSTPTGSSIGPLSGFVFNINQSGATISGTMDTVSGPVGRFDSTSIEGAVTPGSPQMVIFIIGGSGINAGGFPVTRFADAVFFLNQGADANTLVGTWGNRNGAATSTGAPSAPIEFRRQ
jgi:PKD repeat protein